MSGMTMQDRAEVILDIVNTSLKSAQSRKKEIETAIKMLANAGVSDEVLDPLNYEVDAVREEVINLMIHRMLIRAGMIRHGWIKINE